MKTTSTELSNEYKKITISLLNDGENEPEFRVIRLSRGTCKHEQIKDRAVDIQVV